MGFITIFILQIRKQFQFAWASLVAQLVKNLPAMQDTPVQVVGWEDPSEQGTATHSSILAWRIPQGQRSLVGYSPWGLRVGYD